MEVALGSCYSFRLEYIGEDFKSNCTQTLENEGLGKLYM